jgi:hypothetical protein
LFFRRILVDIRLCIIGIKEFNLAFEVVNDQQKKQWLNKYFTNVEASILLYWIFVCFTLLYECFLYTFTYQGVLLSCGKNDAEN